MDSNIAFLDLHSAIIWPDSLAEQICKYSSDTMQGDTKKKPFLAGIKLFLIAYVFQKNWKSRKSVFMMA